MTPMTRKLTFLFIGFAAFALILSGCGEQQTSAKENGTTIEVDLEEFQELQNNVEKLERELEQARRVQQALKTELESLNP
jgi:outer membrane murein-binding lipoprotein Lpp